MDTENRMLKGLGAKFVLDEDGEPILLSELWQEHQTVLIFVRHFG